MSSHRPSSGNTKDTKKLIEMRKFEEKIPEREDNLSKTFDPMRNLHLWTMWRTAVNGRIVDELQETFSDDSNQHPFGKYITKAPLFRFIKFDEQSASLAGNMMGPRSTEANGLRATQFVFYGVPRVVLRNNGRGN